MTLHKDSLRLRDLHGNDLVIDPPWIDRSTGQRFPPAFGEYELSGADAAAVARTLAPELFTRAGEALAKVATRLELVKRWAEGFSGADELDAALSELQELSELLCPE